MDAACAVQVETWSSPACVDALEAADGFGAIVRSERLVATMRRNLALGGVVVAALREETIIGYATTVPSAAVATSPEGIALDRWHDLPDAWELGAIETARPFRRRGIATAILQRWRTRREFECSIVLAHGMASHWESEALGLHGAAYRRMLLALLGTAGFVALATDDPDVRENALNFLAVRVGSGAPASSIAELTRRLHLAP